MRSVRKIGSVIGGAALVFFFTACAIPGGGASRDVVRAAGSKSKTRALNAMTYYAYGHLLERQGNFKRAATQYRLALTRQPRFPSAQNRLGITLNKLAKHDEASQMFRDAIEAAPGQAHLYNNLGFSLLLEGKYTQAESAIRRALELNPKFRRAHMNCGIVLAKLGRDDEAFAEFASVGTDADANFNLAMVQIDARRYDQSRAALRRALALQPDMKAARIQLDRLTTRMNEAETSLAAEAVKPAKDPVASGAEPSTEISPPQPFDLEPVRIAVAVEPSTQTPDDRATDVPLTEQPAPVSAPDDGQTDMGTALERAFADGFDDLDSNGKTAAVSHESVEHLVPPPPLASAEMVTVDAPPVDPPAAVAFEYPYPAATDAHAAAVELSSSLNVTRPAEFDPLLPGLASVTLAALDWLENLNLETAAVGSAAAVSTTPVTDEAPFVTIADSASPDSALTSQAVQSSIGELLVEAEYLAELLFVVQDELDVDEAFALTGKIDALISEQMAEIAALDELRCTLLDREMSVAVADED